MQERLFLWYLIQVKVQKLGTVKSWSKKVNHSIVSLIMIVEADEVNE